MKLTFYTKRDENNKLNGFIDTEISHKSELDLMKMINHMKNNGFTDFFDIKFLNGVYYSIVEIDKKEKKEIKEIYDNFKQVLKNIGAKRRMYNEI